MDTAPVILDTNQRPVTIGDSVVHLQKPERGRQTIGRITVGEMTGDRPNIIRFYDLDDNLFIQFPGKRLGGGALACKIVLLPDPGEVTDRCGNMLCAGDTVLTSLRYVGVIVDVWRDDTDRANVVITNRSDNTARKTVRAADLLNLEHVAVSAVGVTNVGVGDVVAADMDDGEGVTTAVVTSIEETTDREGNATKWCKFRTIGPTNGYRFYTKAVHRWHTPRMLRINPMP